jgi:hypothetical protein
LHDRQQRSCSFRSHVTIAHACVIVAEEFSFTAGPLRSTPRIGGRPHALENPSSKASSFKFELSPRSWRRLKHLFNHHCPDFWKLSTQPSPPLRSAFSGRCHLTTLCAQSIGPQHSYELGAHLTVLIGHITLLQAPGRLLVCSSTFVSYTHEEPLFSCPVPFLIYVYHVTRATAEGPYSLFESKGVQHVSALGGLSTPSESDP